jgi:type I restriction enzyme, R subunit
MTGLTEDDLEHAFLGWLQEVGYSLAFGPDLAPRAAGEVAEPPLRRAAEAAVAYQAVSSEREAYDQCVLSGRLQAALERLNPGATPAAIQEALRALTTPASPDPIHANREAHRLLVEGVPVSMDLPEGGQHHCSLAVIDYQDPLANDLLAVNQFTVIEAGNHRRADVVLFINGLPLVVVELKSPADEKADVKKAWNDLQTYHAQVRSLFLHNATEVISDGWQAGLGTITAPFSRFQPWRTIDGTTVVSTAAMALETLTRGALAPTHLLRLLRAFIVFEDDGEAVSKKVAAYHQYHAVLKAVEQCVRATRPEGDQRVGVVWHTQGSGKSLTMAFFAGAVIQHPDMANPTLVVLTDRNDLDDQLFGTFAACKDLLRQAPVQAADRADLREQLTRASGGVVFTTIQKFMPADPSADHPLLSDRRNIVVIADEAHRSQYDFIDGFAKHMRDALPHAAFIGFTGTPIETTDKNTQAVFGNYIDVYDIQRAVEDGATVRIYYESRLAKITLGGGLDLDDAFEEVTEGEEEEQKAKLKGKWARLEALVGADARLDEIAGDLVEHFDARLEVMDGKAMVVCMSRRICVDLYERIVALRPDWHSDDDATGAVKVVMTGSKSDPPAFQPHIRPKPGRKAMAERFKDPKDAFKLVIVRDMWLTGFDCPSLHTLYLDKPMKGHGLMQAIARVNRVFKDKPGGLVVDYLGVAGELKKALRTYTESGGSGTPTIDQEDAVLVMREKYEIVCGMLHGFDLEAMRATPAKQRLPFLAPAVDHLLALEKGKQRYLDASLALNHAFALSVPHPEALAIREDVAFFQEVRAGILKLSSGPNPDGKTHDDYDHAVRQLVNQAVTSEGVVDIYSAAGIKNPDISILSEDFLEEVRALPQRNLALEMLKRLLADEVQARQRTNLVQAQSFGDMLDKALKKYVNRSIEAAEVIDELIDLAKKMREAKLRGEELGLNDEEVAFYDALAVNDSARDLIGIPELKVMAVELVEMVRGNVTIDWTVKESVRAHLRRMVKRILRKHGYPPDLQTEAVKTVLRQAELLCADWAA